MLIRKYNSELELAALYRLSAGDSKKNTCWILYSWGKKKTFKEALGQRWSTGGSNFGGGRERVYKSTIHAFDSGLDAADAEALVQSLV